MAVDRAQAQRDDHRIRLRAQDVVEVVLESRAARRPANTAATDARPAPLGRRVDEAVGDPPREHDAAQRDRHRGDHPQPQLVVPGQRVGDREQVRQRLPRRRGVGVQRAGQRLVAPDQPAVGVKARAGAGPEDEQRREQRDADPGAPPGVAAHEQPQRPGLGRGAAQRPSAVARLRSAAASSVLWDTRTARTVARASTGSRISWAPAIAAVGAPDPPAARLQRTAATPARSG